MRGGGLYACGFAVTFLWLEAGSVIDDFKQIHLLFDGRIIDFVVNFLIDSFKNTIAAFMWPVYVVQYHSLWGPIALGLAFWLFPTYLKPHVEAWMFDGDVPDESIDADEKLQDSSDREKKRE